VLLAGHQLAGAPDDGLAAPAFAQRLAGRGGASPLDPPAGQVDRQDRFDSIAGRPAPREDAPGGRFGLDLEAIDAVAGGVEDGAEQRMPRSLEFPPLGLGLEDFLPRSR